MKKRLWSVSVGIDSYQDPQIAPLRYAVADACAFHNASKITPEVFGIWMRLLQAMPKSVLWLRSVGASAEHNLRREASARGVESDRLVFAPRTSLPVHFARHANADLFLDTFPYNAHTTASDALWGGLPVLTCAGRSFAARVAGSLLHAVGLPELVTRSLDEYESLALELARDPGLLGTFRERLQRSKLTSPLFDCPRFTRNLEAAYIEMVDTWRQGDAPRPFSVEELDVRG